MNLHLNDGTRPSLLDLGRRATGELDGPVDPVTMAAFARAREQVRPFDFEILRAHAVRLAEEDAQVERVRAPEKRRPWWALAIVPVLAAAVALVAVLPPSGPYVGLKGEGPDAGLYALTLQGGEVRPLRADSVLGEGDQVQFTYDAGGRDTLVLLSIDGSGSTTVFWPESGETPVHIEPDGETLLEGSVELDDAPGPEAFVAVFGAEHVDEAVDLAEAAYDEGGLSGLIRLDEHRPDVALQVVEKRR